MNNLEIFQADNRTRILVELNHSECCLNIRHLNAQDVKQDIELSFNVYDVSPLDNLIDTLEVIRRELMQHAEDNNIHAGFKWER